MWPTLVIILAVAIVALHFFWQRRVAESRDRLTQMERESREAAEQQQRTLARFKAAQAALFNSMSDGVLVLDPGARIQLANEALLRLTGTSRQIIGQTLLEAFRVHPLHALAKNISAPDAVTNLEIDWPGATPRHFLINVAPVFEADQRQHGTLLIFHDLTRLRQLENTRQEFVANVSHELRTPLSLIKGYIETLIDGAKDDPVVLSRFLLTIQKHADRLAYLIDDLLTLSQLESGRAILNFQQTELRPLVDRVIEDLQSPASARRITLRNTVSEEVTIWCDPGRLQQVLLNLIDNGIKYGREDGTVEVGSRNLPDGPHDVWVKDDGAGIPPEARERIFERFYRVDRARSRDQGGTGLGLSIVKHIIHSHGGTVWVESELGRHSTFHFTLPQPQHG